MHFSKCAQLPPTSRQQYTGCRLGQKWEKCPNWPKKTKQPCAQGKYIELSCESSKKFFYRNASYAPVGVDALSLLLRVRLQFFSGCNVQFLILHEFYVLIFIVHMPNHKGWLNPSTTSSRCRLVTTTPGKLANGGGLQRQAERRAGWSIFGRIHMQRLIKVWSLVSVAPEDAMDRTKWRRTCKHADPA